MLTSLPLSASILALALLTTPQSPARPGSQGPIGDPGLVGQCQFVGASHAMTFTPGAMVSNTLVTTADPETRRFIVSVPSSYQPDLGPYPVVYMFHGTGQGAGDMVNNLNWDEASEAMDFIAVFPEALPYLLLDGTTRTKWHTDAVANFVVDPSELPLADDVVFLRELHNTLGAHLNIDCDRIYASGFSNGGAFVKTKVRVDLADIFAATSSAGGIGMQVTTPGEFFPANGVDFRLHYELVGNRDANKIDRCVSQGDLLLGQDLPLAISDIVATPCMWDPLTALAGEIGMDPAIYTSMEQPNGTEILWSVPQMPGQWPREYRFRILRKREYRFRILRNMGHEYPSGNNYPIDYVPILYSWMNQYTR